VVESQIKCGDETRRTTSIENSTDPVWSDMIKIPLKRIANKLHKSASSVTSSSSSSSSSSGSGSNGDSGGGSDKSENNGQDDGVEEFDASNDMEQETMTLKIWDQNHFPKTFLGFVPLSLLQVFEVSFLSSPCILLLIDMVFTCHSHFLLLAFRVALCVAF
jgi:hypothetical protein